MGLLSFRRFVGRKHNLHSVQSGRVGGGLCEQNQHVTVASSTPSGGGFVCLSDSSTWKLGPWFMVVKSRARVSVVSGGWSLWRLEPWSCEVKNQQKGRTFNYGQILSITSRSIVWIKRFRTRNHFLYYCQSPFWTRQKIKSNPIPDSLQWDYFQEKQFKIACLALQVAKYESEQARTKDKRDSVLVWNNRQGNIWGCGWCHSNKEQERRDLCFKIQSLSGLPLISTKT